jgi:hypothetical protein
MVMLLMPWSNTLLEGSPLIKENKTRSVAIKAIGNAAAVVNESPSGILVVRLAGTRNWLANLLVLKAMTWSPIRKPVTSLPSELMIPEYS